MISGAVKKNEDNGNLPEVTLAIRNTSSAAYGGEHPWRVYYSMLAHIQYSCIGNCAILLMIVFGETSNNYNIDIRWLGCVSPRHGFIPWGPEESTEGDRCCGRL